MIKTFLFDLGNVLLFFSHDRMCQQIGALCHESGSEIRELLFGGDQNLNFDRGTISESEFLSWLETETDSTLKLEELRTAVADIFTPNETMFPILDELKKRGHRLVLFSNTNITHIEFVRREYAVLQKFDHLILSYEVEAVKPEVGIYEAALRAIECEPEHCFYTDDIAEYVIAGRQHGLQAEIFTTAASFVEQLQLRGVDLGHLL